MDGFVSLVGAGPGDPGLLTVAGRDRLTAADVVLYDRLVHPDVVALARPGARVVYVGKDHEGEDRTQSEINELLVFYARQGLKVVRLKGGDPFVFGRGGEEADRLAEAGIPFEVIPGISSAVAVPAYAGIPITDRRYGSSVAIVTGHGDPRDPGNPVDFASLATDVDTLVILMGTRRLADIVDVLVENGRPASTPAAAIQWGTYSEQRTVVSTLAELPGALKADGLGAPAVIVVGEIVRMRERIAWFSELEPALELLA